MIHNIPIKLALELKFSLSDKGMIGFNKGYLNFEGGKYYVNTMGS